MPKQCIKGIITFAISTAPALEVDGFPFSPHFQTKGLNDPKNQKPSTSCQVFGLQRVRDSNIIFK